MDIRIQIIEACDAGEGTLREIADRFKVSVHMVKKLLSQRKRVGSLEPQVHRCGRKPLFDQQDLQWLQETVARQPDITLEQLRAQSKKPCCHMTIFRALRQIRLSINDGAVKSAQVKREQL